MENPVQVQFGPVPENIAGAMVNGPVHLCDIPELLRFYLRGNSRITVDAVPDCDRDQMWIVILAVGASIAGFRRGSMPLHASAILARNGCIAFAGQSGTGKSTLTASLLERKYQLFAEDLCLMCVSEDGVSVDRGMMQLRLCADAVRILGWSKPEFDSRSETVKFVFTRAGAGPGSSGLRLRPVMLSVGCAARHFKNLAAIGRQTEIYRFVRPRNLAELSYWTDRVSEHFQ
jgi:hypothetical protein